MFASRKRFLLLLLASVLTLLLTSAAGAQSARYGYGDVTVQLNGGDDVAYIGETNTVEFWIENDATLEGMGIGFEFTIIADYFFDPNHGGSGLYVQEQGRAVGAFDMMTGLLENTAMDDLSPDTLYFGGVTFPGYGLPAGPLELCYTMQFDILPDQGEVEGGFSIDNIVLAVGGNWTFVDASGPYPPDYQGNPNSSQQNPDAPPVCFDIVLPNLPPVITVVPYGEYMSASHCNTIQFDFMALDPDGAEPLIWGASAGDIDPATGQWSIAYSGMQSFDVFITVTDENGLADTCWLEIAFENHPPQLFGPCGDSLIAVPEVALTIEFQSFDRDDCIPLAYSLLNVYPPPNGTMTINSATGEFEFIPAMSDAESFFDVYVGLSDGIGEEEVCQFNILVTLETEEVCGDADTNGMVNIADVVYLINYIFGDGPPPQPLEFGDADCSGLVNIADVVYLIAHIFGGGSAPGDPDNDGIPECVCEKVESCWVIAFGPCCLCKGATQTYFAVGWPPGGSYSWAITAGANKASIVGPNNKSTVQVKGDNVSAATGDVTLTVTYTVGECVATDQVVITVITVALSFDCGGNTSDDNDVPPDASCGLPQLGINSPGNPAGCTGFHKNIEIEGHIEPCDANLASCLTDGWCDIDIKRTRQGRVGFKPGAGAFIPHALDCPSPAWCNDDHHNTDEDLTPSAPPNCNIYVIDTPGMGDVNGACNTTTHVINWLNFKEWVEVNGIKCGEEQEWHATTRIKCVGNKWVMDYGPPGQGVGVGHITIPTPGSRESDSWEGPFSVSLVIDMLSSNSLANRVIGQAMIIDRYDDGKLTENERAELVFELRGLAEVPEHLKARDSTPALAEELLKLLEESLDR